MPKIFICYRREDSAYAAQQIYRELIDHFGSESVVFDVDAIPLGTDFREHLNKEVSKCDILLAVIGNQWIEILKQRLDEPNDFVRIEIQAALERKIPVVPILVDKASVPGEKNLPPELAGLAYRNAAEVRAGHDLQNHLKRLIGGLDRLLAERKAEEERRRKAEENRKRKEAEAKHKAEDERKHKEAEARLRAEEERKRREVKAEIEPDKSELAKVKPPEPKADATAPAEPKSPKPRRTGNALKFGVLAGVAVLLIVGIWWYVSESQKKKLQIEVESKIERILTGIALLEQSVFKTESLEQLNDSYKKSDDLGRDLSDIERMSAVVGLSQKAEKARKSLEELIRLLNTQKQKLDEEEQNRKAAEEERIRKAKEERMTPPKFLTNTIGMKYVLIPAGSFTMGSPLEEPGRDDDEKLHEVTISKPFYLQTTEVTQGQWKRVMKDNPSRFKESGDDCPVENVSWDDAQKFIKRLNEMEGNNKFKYRLPTEAEWEYACRARTNTSFSFKGDASKLNEYGWYSSNSERRTHPVKTLKPNLWGLYDMHGNVWEWCQDWYGDYPSSPITDPKGSAKGARRVLRGGSWNYHEEDCWSANRAFNSPDGRLLNLGFRLARSVALGS